MNKFNGKARSAVKIRKVAARAQRKKSGVQEKHKKGQKLQSGLRTGKTKRRQQKVETKRLKAAVQAGDIDLDMPDAELK